jgi:hypothetical protein
MGIKANTLEAGIVELATNAETVTGTDVQRAVTPAGVAAAFATPPSMGAVTATELNVATGTITASNPALDATQTWNSGGVTFTGLKANITDTASAAASMLADLQVGGSSKFSVRKDGLTNIVGDLDHDGTNVGFFGVTPAARPSAYTQTYSTADKTHANPTAVALTDNTTGTANTTLQAIPDPADTPASADALRDDIVANDLPAIRNNFADLAASNNAIIADLADVKQLLNSVIDDLQSLGILQ